MTEPISSLLRGYYYEGLTLDRAAFVQESRDLFPQDGAAGSGEGEGQCVREPERVDHLTDFRDERRVGDARGQRRLFVGCRQPARLLIFDATSGRIAADLAISGDTDDLFYDAKLKRIYISCGEGFIGQRQCGMTSLANSVIESRTMP